MNLLKPMYSSNPKIGNQFLLCLLIEMSSFEPPATEIQADGGHYGACYNLFYKKHMYVEPISGCWIPIRITQISGKCLLNILHLFSYVSNDIFQMWMRFWYVWSMILL